MKLPQGLPKTQSENQWASIIEPVLNAPIVDGSLMTGIVLISGTTVVNHKLGRKLVGWLIVGSNAAATVYDNQATNQTPQLTLSLTSSAAVTVNLWVF